MRESSGGSRSRGAELAALVLLLVGVVLRLGHLFGRGALWGDEGALAMNIVPPSFGELGDPFRFDQICPLGFLYVAKVVTSILGPGDAALRTLPLLMGVVACCCAYAAAVASFGRVVGVFALAVMALTPELIHYSAELKPYSTDAAVGAGLLCLTLRCITTDGRMRDRWLLITLAAGAAAAWLSLPSLMVLGGAGITLLYDAVFDRTRDRRIVWIAAAGVAWLGLFGFHLSMITAGSPVASDGGAVVYWSDGFWPFPPRSFAELKWPVGKFFYTFVDPGGFALRYLAGAVWLLGFYLIARRRRAFAVAVAAPVVLLLAASALGRYPALSRLIHFVTPGIALPMGAGFAAFFLTGGPRRNVLVARAAGVVLLLVLFFEPVQQSFSMATKTRGLTIVEAVQLLKTRRKPDEPIYIDGINWQYYWYAYREGFEAEVGTMNDIRDDLGDPGHYPRMKEVADRYAGRARVWMALGNVGIPEGNLAWRGSREPLDVFIPRHLAAHGGRIVERHDHEDLTLFLYDLSAVSTTTTAN